MFVNDSSPDTPSGLLGIRSRMHFTGRLDVRTSGQQWSLYLYMGRLIWASGGPHPWRRLHRYLTQHCPQINANSALARGTGDGQGQDYNTLSLLVKQQQITPEQAVAVIRSTVAEVLFDIIQQEETKLVTFESDAHDVLDTSLALVNAEQMLTEVQQVWNAWRSLGLADHSPNLAPALRHPEQLQQHTPERVYKMLISLVDGRRTLRDLSVLTKQDLLQITRLLVPLYRKGLIALTKVSDLVLPGTAPPRSISTPPTGGLEKGAPGTDASAFKTPRSGVITSPPRKNSVDSPLIACIDDSLRECQAMEKIVTEAGFRFLGIQDSLQALPLLLEQKPSLIFLDLVMPVANGYEICAQIRRVSLFKQTPIVILTSNDGIIDRVRARFVGSSGFLAKPPEVDRVLAVIRKLLPIRN